MVDSVMDSVAQESKVDVVVVGAGFGGLNALHNLRAQGLRAVLLEAGPAVGGTWYWNTYPGARVDIESVEYSYGFSDVVQQEWRWPLRYSMQADVQRYLEWVADRLDLRADIRLNARVRSAHFDEDRGRWRVVTEQGQLFDAHFCVMALGFLSAVNLPQIEGLSDFAGRLVHTGAWPSDGVELQGKRVGVIGAGASAVQISPVIARQVGHLTLFQRTPNWCFPIVNEEIDETYETFVKTNYPEIRKFEHFEGIAGMILVNKQIRRPSAVSALDVSEDERTAVYEEFWRNGGPHFAWTFRDVTTNLEANRTLREFCARKIREIVEDPEVAERLIPNHPPYARRPPGVTGYYEMFNRPNVSLVSLREDPIRTVTADGVELESGRHVALDVLICATGFDAGAGSLLRIDVRGRAGISLSEHWRDRVRTSLGLMTANFPNLFVINGAQSPAPFFSPPLMADYQSRYIGRLIEQLRRRGATIVEPTVESELAWGDHLDEVVNQTLIPYEDSWWMGGNVPGKPRQVQAYVGSFAEYQARAERAAADLNGFVVEAAARGLGVG